MHAIDKTQFGEFLSQQRRARGMTQKELAEKLFVSDKAVSKWERGLSLPDISLLIPLAELLGTTVTELLEGKTLEEPKIPDSDQLESLIKKAVSFSELSPEQLQKQRNTHLLTFLGCAGVVLLELAMLLLSGLSYDVLYSNNVFLMVLMPLGFALYFWVFAKERLPVYYDENQINAYSDGVFRMNLPGVSFNNSNWPYILRAGRWCCVGMAVFYPFLFWGLYSLFPLFWGNYGRIVSLIWILAGLFIPLYIAGKKYE